MSVLVVSPSVALDFWFPASCSEHESRSSLQETLNQPGRFRSLVIVTTRVDCGDRQPRVSRPPSPDTDAVERSLHRRSCRRPFEDRSMLGKKDRRHSCASPDRARRSPPPATSPFGGIYSSCRSLLKSSCPMALDGLFHDPLCLPPGPVLFLNPSNKSEPAGGVREESGLHHCINSGTCCHIPLPTIPSLDYVFPCGRRRGFTFPRVVPIHVTPTWKVGTVCLGWLMPDRALTGLQR